MVIAMNSSSKRKLLVAGNWKMHGSKQSVQALLTGLLEAQSATIQQPDVAVFPPYVFLDQVSHLLSKSSIEWGAQNMDSHLQGAFTGEISASMLRDFGCRYVLLGHSERRSLFGETNALVAAKYQTAISAGLIPVVCVGETLEQRQQQLTDQIIHSQLEAIFTLENGINSLNQAIIAYEPVWAIGTGMTASPEMAQAVHEKIRFWVAEYDKTIAQNLRILYGGSVKGNNASALFAMPDIDGGLIGGASLDLVEFLDIIKLCSN